MKKLVFAIVALAAVSFVSCGNEAKPVVEEPAVDSTVVEEVADTVAAAADTVAAVADSAVAEVAETVTK